MKYYIELIDAKKIKVPILIDSIQTVQELCFEVDLHAVPNWFEKYILRKETETKRAIFIGNVIWHDWDTGQTIRNHKIMDALRGWSWLVKVKPDERIPSDARLRRFG